MKTEIKINEFLTVTEKVTREKGQTVYNYYVGKCYIFGALNRFSHDDLENLYNNNYFEDYIITRVIFRKDKSTGEIIAFFPESYEYGDLMCYVHNGQHGNATIQYYWNTSKATPQEYHELLTELTDLIGYKNLKVMQRMTY